MAMTSKLIGSKQLALIILSTSMLQLTLAASDGYEHEVVIPVAPDDCPNKVVDLKPLVGLEFRENSNMISDSDYTWTLNNFSPLMDLNVYIRKYSTVVKINGKDVSKYFQEATRGFLGFGGKEAKYFTAEEIIQDYLSGKGEDHLRLTIKGAIKPSDYQESAVFYGCEKMLRLVQQDSFEPTQENRENVRLHLKVAEHGFGLSDKEIDEAIKKFDKKVKDWGLFDSIPSEVSEEEESASVPRSGRKAISERPKLFGLNLVTMNQEDEKVPEDPTKEIESEEETAMQREIRYLRGDHEFLKHRDVDPFREYCKFTRPKSKSVDGLKRRDAKPLSTRENRPRAKTLADAQCHAEWETMPLQKDLAQIAYRHADQKIIAYHEAHPDRKYIKVDHFKEEDSVEVYVDYIDRGQNCKGWFRGTIRRGYDKDLNNYEVKIEKLDGCQTNDTFGNGLYLVDALPDRIREISEESRFRSNDFVKVTVDGECYAASYRFYGYHEELDQYVHIVELLEADIGPVCTITAPELIAAYDVNDKDLAYQHGCMRGRVEFANGRYGEWTPGRAFAYCKETNRYLVLNLNTNKKEIIPDDPAYIRYYSTRMEQCRKSEEQSTCTQDEEKTSLVLESSDASDETVLDKPIDTLENLISEAAFVTKPDLSNLPSKVPLCLDPITPIKPHPVERQNSNDSARGETGEDSPTPEKLPPLPTLKRLGSVETEYPPSGSSSTRSSTDDEANGGNRL